MNIKGYASEDTVLISHYIYWRSQVRPSVIHQGHIRVCDNVSFYGCIKFTRHFQMQFFSVHFFILMQIPLKCFLEGTQKGGIGSENDLPSNK